MSEEELLLLSNYAYFSCSVKRGSIAENITALKNPDGSFNMEQVIRQGATGDIISEDNAVDILTRLENNPKLAGLKLKECINDGDLRAALYEDSTGQATLVFRGTGGTYDAWEDNVLGAMESDTKIQKRAADFVKNECGGYKDIEVTGHSKGGNLAQYVTVTCNEQVKRCVSFDGQGFGQEFLDKYKEDILKTKDNITCINGYNDFVNILLTPIGGTYLYVHNKGGIGVSMHSCYTILEKAVFDEEGNFDREKGVRTIAPEIAVTKLAIDKIMNRINDMPDYMREGMIGFIGAYTAGLFSDNMGEEYEKKRLNDALEELENAINYSNTTKEETQEDYLSGDYMFRYLYINIDKVRSSYIELDELSKEIRTYPVIVEDVLVNLDFNIRGIAFTETALKRIIAKLDKNIERVERLKSVLKDVIVCYERADSVA